MVDRGLLRPHTSKIDTLIKFVDMALIAGTYAFSVYVQGGAWGNRDSLTLVIGIGAFYVCAKSNGVYESWRIFSIGQELGRIAYSWLAAVFVLFLCALAFDLFKLTTRWVVVVWVSLALLALLGLHGGVRSLTHWIRARGRNTRRVAIIGATPSGADLVRHISDSPWMGLRLLGYYDDRTPAPDRTDDLSGVAYLGTVCDAIAAARNGEIDLAFITLPFRAELRIGEAALALADTTVAIYYVHDYSAFDLLNGRLFPLGDMMVVAMRESPFFGADGLLKRAEDVALTMIALPIIAVPWALIAIGIKLTSRGPVIFQQRRYGLNGKEFRIYKFRTMMVMEDGEDIRQASANDSRVTRFGRFLRRTSLDELPQFINVLKGEMSVVGPRPHAATHNEIYRKIIKSYMVRHTIKPGITGWAQVNGFRGETDAVEKMERRVRFDIQYIRRWSLLLDLKILLMTLTCVVRNKNAY